MSMSKTVFIAVPFSSYIFSLLCIFISFKITVYAHMRKYNFHYYTPCVFIELYSFYMKDT